MTLLEELGLKGPIRALSDEDRNRYHRVVTARYRARPGKAEMKAKRMAEYRKQPEVIERNKEVARQYRQRDYVKRRAVEAAKVYASQNRDKVNKWMRERHKQRYAEDPAYRVKHNIRSRLGFLARNKYTKSTSLNLDGEALRAHIESQWGPWMNWENYGTEWHIDHKIPCSHFDFRDPEQVKQCFSLENLQPLEARANLRKSNKIGPEWGNDDQS